MKLCILDDVEDAIEKVINREADIHIEITCRWTDAWTISGADNEVHTAIDWLAAHNLMRLESVIHDDELDETFAYMAS